MRELRGLSRQQIADTLSVDLTAAAAWEAGKYLPREGRRVRLATLLSTDVGTLFAEEQVPGPATGAALLDPLAELPGLLRELINNTANRLRIFRQVSSQTTKPYVQEEFRRQADSRLLSNSIAIEAVEAFCSLERLKEALTLVLRYSGRGYRLRAALPATGAATPGLSGYLFDEQEVLLGGFWPEAEVNGHNGLRLSGWPYCTFFDQYWGELWSHGTPLNPNGEPDLAAIRAEAIRLGLAEQDWDAFLGEAGGFNMEDGLPPRV